MQPSTKPVSLYRAVLIALSVIILFLLVLAFALPGWRVGLGISIRLLIAVFCFLNSAGLFRERRSIIPASLLLLLGLWLIVTALLGYSFNGIPRQFWLFPSG